jgi:hypothetical protein
MQLTDVLRTVRTAHLRNRQIPLFTPSTDDIMLKWNAPCYTKERFHNFISFPGNHFVRECARTQPEVKNSSAAVPVIIKISIGPRM